LVIDDVVSAGTSVRESVDIISASGASVCGIVVCLDRQEKGTGERSAIQEIEDDLQIKVISMFNLSDLVNFLEQKNDLKQDLEKIKTYRLQYGVDV
jgi:orotate phosphoribosyltransferase